MKKIQVDKLKRKLTQRIFQFAEENAEEGTTMRWNEGMVFAAEDKLEFHQKKRACVICIRWCAYRVI